MRWKMRTEVVIVLLHIFVMIHGLVERPEPKPVLSASETPYIVSLQLRGAHEVTGVLIDESHILTSAVGLSPSLIYVYRIVAGRTNWANGAGQIRNLSKINFTPSYCFVQGDMMGNNLGILRVDTPFELNEYVQPIKLPPAGHLAEAVGIASGWINSTGSTILRKLEDFPILRREDCKSFFGRYKYRDSHLCAGFIQDDEIRSALDSNYGFDSGTPIICRDKENSLGYDYLCGVFSYTNLAPSCPDSTLEESWGFPMVFTQVSNYIQWIENYINTP